MAPELAEGASVRAFAGGSTAAADAASPSMATRQLRLGTLTLIRWVAVAGQALAIIVIYYGLGFNLPLSWAMVVVGASVMLNLFLALERPAGALLADRAAAWFLAYDIGQLAVLLYLTGGLENPFALLLLAPVTVSATILSLRSTLILCAFSLFCIAVLAVWHMPLPWASGGFQLPAVYVLGAWVSLAIGIVFFASYNWRVAEEARRMSAALVATQLALAREQRLSALGGLAAAAAHELGSPLGTIAIAAHEIARDLPPDSPLTDDVDLLISETARCRDILVQLARQPKDDDSEALSRFPFDALVETAAAPHFDDRIDFRIDSSPDEGAQSIPMPHTARSPEIVHGLGNLIQNATQFAATRVDVAIGWSASSVSVTVSDDGRGFPARLLERLGEPYLSQRDGGGEHMGLGIFIAETLLQRTGAKLKFGNRPEGGAEVVVSWPRAAIDVPPRNAKRVEGGQVGRTADEFRG